ncbi:MAG: hypothetical protein AAGH76_01985 [Pseudomonadota bacterium]
MSLTKTATWLAIPLCAVFCALPADAATLRTSLESCEQAIAAELGDGRLRHSVLKSHQQGGNGRHWINVRHRAAGETETSRYRVVCETSTEGQVATLAMDPGRWKATRANRAPKAAD